MSNCRLIYSESYKYKHIRYANTLCLLKRSSISSFNILVNPSEVQEHLILTFSPFLKCPYHRVIAYPRTDIVISWVMILLLQWGMANYATCNAFAKTCRRYFRSSLGRISVRVTPRVVRRISREVGGTLDTPLSF